MSDDDVGWRAKLDVALDAMKLGAANGSADRAAFDGKEIAERLFDELDELHPGWHFEVPMRARGVRRSTRTEVRRVLAAMLCWAGWPQADIASVFGVNYMTAVKYIRRGERLLLNPRRAFALGHKRGVFRSSYERQYLKYDRIKDEALLEEDCAPEDERRYRRWLAAGMPATRRAAAWRKQWLLKNPRIGSQPVEAPAP